MLPDALDRAVDEDNGGDPPLLSEDPALVGLSKDWLDIARHPYRVGIEEWEQVNRLRRFQALHWLKRLAQSEGPLAFYLDFFQFVF